MNKKSNAAQPDETPESTELATQTPGELTMPDDLMSEMMEDEGKGTENLTSRDIALPFLVALQKGSPQCDDAHEKYIEGAKPGMLYDTVLERIYDGKVGAKIILCGTTKALVEWLPRDSGGGLVGQHPFDSPIVEKTQRNGKNQMILPGGNLLIETAYNFILFQDPETGVYRPMVLAMQSTQLKTCRKWMALITMRTATVGRKTFKPPMFGQIFNISTSIQKKDQYTWYGWVIEPQDELVSDMEIYKKAKGLNTAVSAGKIQVSGPPVDHEVDSGESNGSSHEEEGVPF